MTGEHGIHACPTAVPSRFRKRYSKSEAYLACVFRLASQRSVSPGAGGWTRTSTPLREGDFKTWKKRQRVNVLLTRCLFSLRGLRAATVFYERYGHPGGQRPTMGRST